MNIITEETLSENLKFIALFIGVYESFEDYVIDCPKQLFGDDSTMRNDLTDEIRKKDEQHKREKENAREYLKNCNRTAMSEKDFERIDTLANYDYIRETIDGYVQWLSPHYNKLIHKRELLINPKGKNRVLFNSVMFFVDSNAISQIDFDTFIKIRELRNRFAHEMAKLITIDIPVDWKQLFDKLVNLYIRINNYWSVNFELGIGGEDIPTDIEIDYDNVITDDLYHLFLSIDVLQNTEFVATKKYRVFIGLYNALRLPIYTGKTNVEDTKNAN